VYLARRQRLPIATASARDRNFHAARDPDETDVLLPDRLSLLNRRKPHVDDQHPHQRHRHHQVHANGNEEGL